MMEVKRTATVNTDEFQVGDIISFKLTGGEKIKALAVKTYEDATLFVTLDCLAKEYPMFESFEGLSEKEITYQNSTLRKKLNSEIIARFPKEITDRMIAVNSWGDYLRIPTEKEIFGENVYGQEEDKSVKRWKPMKKRRNRIAFQGNNGNWEWYWLENRHKESASSFAPVYSGGNAYSNGASGARGVRPVFLLS